MTFSGIGIGLRMEMAEQLLERKPSTISWVEVHPENYLLRAGKFADLLSVAREEYPIVTHGLTMSFGCVTPFEREYLDPLKSFLKEIGTPWHSDHMCFGGAHGQMVHDLLPIPFTDEALDVVCARYTEARDHLDHELAIENVSYYAPPIHNDGPREGLGGLAEAAFLTEMLTRTDGKLMLDVNNVFVNSQNFGFDPRTFFDQLPLERVVQMHVAGHQVRPDGLRIDTHGEPICDEVFALLEYVLEKTGPVPVLLERDNNIPSLDTLIAEAEHLASIYARATSSAA